MFLNNDPPPTCLDCNARVITARRQTIRCKECVYKRFKYSTSRFKSEYMLKYIVKEWQGLISKSSKIELKCSKHGIFKQCLSSALNNRKCQKCHIENKIRGKTKRTLAEWIGLFNKAHSDTYNYYLVPEKVKSTDRIQIICKVHGEFLQQASLHAEGFGCCKCSNTSAHTSASLTAGIINVHGDNYDTSLVDINEYKENRKVTLICKIHGTFSSYYSNITNKKTDCPYCMQHYTTSKKEREWLLSFNNPNIHYNCKLILKDESIVYPDGYDKTTNTVYEFHGDFWHGNPLVYCQTDVNPVTKVLYSTLYKNTICKTNTYVKNGYTVIEIWESNWK